MIKQSFILFFILFLLSLLLSFALTGLLFKIMTIKAKARNCMLFLLGLLPIVFTYLWNPLSRTLVNHGFFHISTVYQIINSNGSPKDPILAGYSLTYPWGYSFLSAVITSGIHLSPDNSFALINLFSLSLTMFLVFRIGVLWSSDWTAGVFAVLLSIFGVSVINRGLVAEVIKVLIPFISLEKRVAIPNKFFNIASTCIGIVFFALFIYSITQIFEKSRKVTIYYIALTISLLGAGFLYPQFWPGMIASCVTSCTVIYLRNRRVTLYKIIGISICIFTTSVIIFPYLQHIGSGNSEKIVANLLNPNFNLIFIKVFRYLWGTLPLFIILLWKWKTFLDFFRRKTDYTLILITIVVTTALMYIFLSFFQGNEYKYYILSWIGLGILASVCLSEIYLNNRVICFILTSTFLLLISTELLYFSFGNSIVYPFSFDRARYSRWQPSDKYVRDGIYLRHTDPDEDALYQWIKSQTEQDAIFLDTHLTIPVFAQRQLYVGLDIRRNSFTKNIEDGWGIRAETFLKQGGYSSDIVERRIRIGNIIFSNLNTQIKQDIISELKRISSKSSLYVVVRNFDPTIHNKFKNNNNFARVFEKNGTAVYKLLNNADTVDKLNKRDSLPYT